MTHHKHQWLFEEQECSDRINRPFKLIEERGLLSRCKHIPARHVTNSELLRVHSEDYIEIVKNSANMGSPELYKLSGNFDGVFFNSHTWEASSLAVGSVTELASQVGVGELKNALALIRPPGHHAMYDEACGYCIFSNVAVAAANLLDSPPLSVFNPSPSSHKSAVLKTPPQELAERRHFKRILIIDWDVHQGQGTQYAFYNDNRVLFISIHRYERQKFWPNLREGDFDFIGDGAGRGYNINIPLNKVGLTDGDYLAIFHSLIMPIAYEFDPEIVIVSSGFDAALGDPEGKMNLSPACYGHMTHQLRSLADGKLVVVLEGGYFIDSLEEGCVQVLKALLGDFIAPIQNICPPSKRLLVKGVKWPEKNPVLSEIVISNCLKTLRNLSSVASKRSCFEDIAFVLPQSTRSSFMQSLKNLNLPADSHDQHLFYQEEQSPSKGDVIIVPKKKARLKESDFAQNLPNLYKSVEDAALKLTKSGFRASLMAAEQLLPGEIILILNRMSSKQPSGSRQKRGLKGFSKIFYVDLAESRELTPSIFGQFTSSEVSNRISVLAFSFGSSGSEVNLKSPNPQMNLINVPLWCCRSRCRHAVANVFAVLDALILPMAYEFSPDLLIINVGDSITKERVEMPRESVMHVVFLMKNVAARLFVLMPSAIGPDNLLYCLLNGSPPAPFKMTHSTVSSSTLSRSQQCLSVTAFAHVLYRNVLLLLLLLMAMVSCTLSREYKYTRALAGVTAHSFNRFCCLETSTQHMSSK
ncbi:hypothetical protein Aperf_G00000073041 [Anoplocephala perfoliata]